ncbi:uncharacterized protein hspb12 [Brachyhypopomus gauderio]|uniref:uncharacterized protein hspb12 n=1 Tax=Brachyhypopomus gauderio TaxID=698409 RepID=UPI004042A33C
MTSPANSSSSSFCSSSCYSCTRASSIQMQGSAPKDFLLQPFLDKGSHSLFGEELCVSSLPLPPLGNHHSSSYQLHKGGQDSTPADHNDSFRGYKEDLDLYGSHRGEREGFGGYQGDRKSCSGSFQGDWSHGDSLHADSGRPASMGVVHTAADSYYLSADVGHFEPDDIVVMAYNHSIVIHAEKVGGDGCIRDKFSHRSVLPEDMDPLSVSGTLTSEGMLMVNVRRICKPPL